MLGCECESKNVSKQVKMCDDDVVSCHHVRICRALDPLNFLGRFNQPSYFGGNFSHK